MLTRRSFKSKAKKVFNTPKASVKQVNSGNLLSPENETTEDETPQLEMQSVSKKNTEPLECAINSEAFEHLTEAEEGSE